MNWNGSSEGFMGRWNRMLRWWDNGMMGQWDDMMMNSMIDLMGISWIE